MNKFIAGIPFTKVDHNRRIIAGYASVEVVDRDGEIVKREALEKALAEYMENPIIRWMHKEEPIGKVLNAYVDDKGLFVEAYITDKTPEGKKAWGLIEDGIVKAFSIGGSVLNKEYKTLEDGKSVGVITDLTLREISVVDIPANPKSFFEIMVKMAGSDEEAGASDEECDFCKGAGISTGAWNPPSSKEDRQKLKDKCGARAFLLPGELKFPVMDMNCRYNINGVRAAITRAAQHGYKQVEAKARRLYERLKRELEQKGVFIGDLEKSEAKAVRFLANIVEDLDALYTYVKNNVDNEAIVGKARDVLNAVMAALKELRGGKMAENEIMKQEEQPQVEVQEEQKQEEAPAQEAQAQAEQPAQPEQTQEAPVQEEQKEASEEVGELNGNGVNDLLSLAKKDAEKKEAKEEEPEVAKIDEATIEKIVELIEKKLEERKGVAVEEKKEEKISGAEAMLKLLKGE